MDLGRLLSDCGRRLGRGSDLARRLCDLVRRDAFPSVGAPADGAAGAGAGAAGAGAVGAPMALSSASTRCFCRR